MYYCILVQDESKNTLLIIHLQFIECLVNVCSNEMIFISLKINIIPESSNLM